MKDSEEVSLTVKGISKKSKENFSLFCTMYGKSMNEVLKDFINSVYAPNETQKQYMMIQTVNNLLMTNPDLVDNFIKEIEPMYKTFDDYQMPAVRSTFVAMNPSNIYSKYNNWLQEE